MAFQPAIFVLDARVSFMEPAELERAEVDVPLSQEEAIAFAAAQTHSEPSYAVCINRLSPEPPKGGRARRTEVVSFPREIVACLTQKSPVCS